MFQSLFKKIGVNKLFIISVCLIIFIVVSFLFSFADKDTTIYFLDVGQGDSEFINISGKVDILIDGGPINNKVIKELSRVMPFTDRYIDLVIMTHPELDHFGGLIDVFKRYKVGAFIYNGQKVTALALADLERAIDENGAKKIILQPGDEIHYRTSNFKIMGNSDENINDLNNNSLVLKSTLDGVRVLFAGDIGEKIEKQIKSKIGSIDILKVPHHGSKYSSSAQFLNIIKPKVSVIEVGRNSYGHPAEDTLRRLKAIKSRILRTDQLGTIKIVLDGDKKGVIQFSSLK